MTIFLLWFSIFTFTVFCLSILPVILGWRQKGRRKAEFYYFLLMLAYCFWLIIFSILFFSDVFVRPIPIPAKTGFGLLRTLITVVVLVLYPMILSETSKQPYKRFSRILIWIVPVFYILLIIPVLTRGSLLFFTIITILYNLYFIWLSVSALLINASGINRSSGIHTFIKLMLIYHAASLLLYIIQLWGMTPVYIMISNVLPRSAFCLSWGIIEIVIFIKREYRKEKEGAVAVSSVFTDDFSITAREKDIINCISGGLSYKKTAEKLFISEKTVETHIYSIYRKCNVKNKVELLNMIANHY